MAEFCSACSNTISPPQWTTLSPPLTHLGGERKRERISKGLWSDPRLESYVSPENINVWQDVRKSTNDDIILNGKAICEHCADLRSEGRRPNSNMINDFVQNIPE